MHHVVSCCGLPPGPGGSLRALEGASFLALAAIAAWSVSSKVSSGAGLARGVLGVVKGLTFATIGAGMVQLGLQVRPPPTSIRVSVGDHPQRTCIQGWHEECDKTQISDMCAYRDCGWSAPLK